MRLHIVTRLSGLVMDLYTRVLEWLMELRCKLVKPLLVKFIHTFQNVGMWHRNLSAQLKLNIKLWLVQYIVRAQLIKAALINVLTKLGVRGLRLLTTVRQILQRVFHLQKHKH